MGSPSITRFLLMIINLTIIPPKISCNVGLGPNPQHHSNSCTKFLLSLVINLPLLEILNSQISLLLKTHTCLYQLLLQPYCPIA